MGKHLHSATSTENAKENDSDMPGWADKNFQGGTNFLAQSLKNFILGQKFSGGQFFLDSSFSPCNKKHVAQGQ